MERVSFDAVKGFNEAWRNSGRKESEIFIRYQYKTNNENCAAWLFCHAAQFGFWGADQNSRFLSVSLEKTWATLPLKEKCTVSPMA